MSGSARPISMLCTMQCMCLSGFCKQLAAGTDQCTLHGSLAPLLLKVLRGIHLRLSFTSLFLLLSGFLLSLEVFLAQLLLLHGPKTLQRTLHPFRVCQVASLGHSKRNLVSLCSFSVEMQVVDNTVSRL